MSKTLEKVAARPHVWFVDDERSAGNSIIITLREGWFFSDDPGCGTQGFDNVRDAEIGTRASECYFDETEVKGKKSLLTHQLCLRAQKQSYDAAKAVRPYPQHRYSRDAPPELWVEPARRSHSDLFNGVTHLATDPAYKYVKAQR